MIGSLIGAISAWIIAPFLLSVINRTKALFGGRQGQPWLQPYYDLWRLIRKGAVYSHTTSWVFRAGPMIGLAAIFTATLMVPFGGASALLSFPGDFLLLIYLLGVARFFTMLAALDTGSAFEGMGSNREAWFSALAEPALMLGIATIAREMGGGKQELLSLSGIHLSVTTAAWGQSGFELALVAIALVVIMLSENSRIPIDDPTTHLELTMIHEVMVLDHSGPDFAYILYSAALKLWVFASLLIGLLLPFRVGFFVVDLVLELAAVLGVAFGIGVVESIMARLRMPRVPQLLVGAIALAAFAFVLERHGVLLQ